MRNKYRVSPENKIGNSKNFILNTPTQAEPIDRKCGALWVFHPESIWRLLWDIQIMLIIVYQAVTVPFLICFEVSETKVWMIADFIMTCIFIFDIVLTFNTGFYRKGTLIMHRKQITKNYLKFWFWLDFLASVPYSWMIDGVFQEEDSSDSEDNLYRAPQLLRLIKIFRFLRILKLLRLAKLKRILIKIEDYIASNTLATLLIFFRLLSVVFFIAHWTACWWYFVGSQDMAVHPVTWVVDAGIQDASVTNKYIAALYWAFTTMTTVGYGDITPFTPNEKIYAMFSMIVACGVFAYTVGSIGSLVSKQSALENVYREQFVAVNRFMRKKALPQDLQFKVRRYLEYVWEDRKKRNLGEKQILSLLSDPLRDDVNDHIHGVIIKTFEVFNNYDTNFLSQLTRKLEKDTFAPGDIVIEEGERSSSLFFILNGQIELYHESTSSAFITLSSKTYFGEIGFYTGKPRCASARCLDYVDLLSLSKLHMQSLEEKFPKAKERTDNILDSISNGDLSSLKVMCYMCSSIGHVAINCNQVSLKVNPDLTRKLWIDKQENARQAIVNPYIPFQTEFRRIPMKKVVPIVSSKNIVGIKREAKNMYPFASKLKSYHESFNGISISEDPGKIEDEFSEEEPEQSYFDSEHKESLIFEDHVKSTPFSQLSISEENEEASEDSN